MPEYPEDRTKRQRLRAIADALALACDEADTLSAYLLAAKIEDSRICVEEMLRTLAD